MTGRRHANLSKNEYMHDVKAGLSSLGAQGIFLWFVEILEHTETLEHTINQ